MALLFGNRPVSAPAPGYVIRQANLDDVAVMDRIEQEAFTTPWSLDLIRGAVINRRYQVRILGGSPSEVAGFYIAHTVEDASNLDNLAVNALHRRRGLGRRLVEDWIAVVKGQRLGTLTLQVNTRNLAAQKLYRDFCFRPTRLLTGYYPNGEDAYQMEMTLPAPPPPRAVSSPALGWAGK
ncbi:MAG TPA: GNAT family N-acetyltransferase [bacterium]|nr:GNAT family N-acetyltransferase [bacterium]